MSRTRHLTIICSCLLFAACGNADSPDSSGSSGSPGASVAEIGDGLAPGEFEVDIHGHIRTVGPYTGDREPVNFHPNNYGRSRELADGRGGRQHVTATNADGPYRLHLYIQLQVGDDDPEPGSIMLQLPPDVRAGQTYVMATPRLARHGEAVLAINGDGRVLGFGGTGTVTVAELDEHASLHFEFHGGSAEQNNERHLVGRAYRIPVTPRGEAQYELVIDGEAGERVLPTRFRNDWSIHVGQELMFDFPGQVAQPGTYQIGNRRGAGVASVSIQDHRGVDYSGSIEIRQDGDTWSGTFELQGEGDHSIRSRGGFEHVAARRGHL